MDDRGKTGPRRFYARPADRSFAAFQEFIAGMTAALGGQNDVSDDDLREAWQEFWAAANRDRGTGGARWQQ